jgi:hypothetical protein
LVCVGLGVGFGVDLCGDAVGDGDLDGDLVGDFDGDFDGDLDGFGELFEVLGEALDVVGEDACTDWLAPTTASLVWGRSQPTIPTPRRTRTAAVTTATAIRPFLGMPEDDEARCDLEGPSPGGGVPVVTPRCRVGGPTGPAGGTHGPGAAA